MMRRRVMQVPETFWKKIKIEAVYEGLTMTKYMEDCAGREDSIKSTLNKKKRPNSRFYHGF